MFVFVRLKYGRERGKDWGKAVEVLGVGKEDWKWRNGGSS